MKLVMDKLIMYVILSIIITFEPDLFIADSNDLKRPFKEISTEKSKSGLLSTRIKLSSNL